MYKKNKKLFTSAELAKMCNVSPVTIFRAISKKQLRAGTTPGGHYRILREDAEAFLKKNRIPWPGKEPRQKQILIVEDNPVELRLFQKAFKGVPSIKVASATTGYEAGVMTEELKPDLILLDFYLPDIDGCKVAKLTRSRPDLKHTKIVGISVIKDKRKIKRLLKCCFDDFIQKPIAPNKLKDKVLQILG